MRYSIFIFLLLISLASCKKKAYTISNGNIDSLKVFVPTTFTPNNDGPKQNEIFKPIITFGAYKIDSPSVFVYATISPLKVYEMEIRDLDNQKLFYTNNIQKGWDGEYKNTSMPPGLYRVFIHFEGKNDGIKNINAEFMLIR